MTDQKAILTIKDLSIGLIAGGVSKPIVSGIDMTIDAGEAVGIVGESGSGKSLTALAIGGLLPAALSTISGGITLDGINVTKLPEAQFHRVRGTKVGYVFQDPLNALNPTRTIGNHLLDVIRRHSDVSGVEARERAVAVLHSVGITQPEDRLRAYPHQLSGGMRQRVLIAMALVCNPRLLIADEPTTALDVTVQAKIIDLFRGFREQGISIMFISHNLDLVLEFCDTVVVMYGGQIMEKGTASEIAEAPRHPYTCALMDCVPRLSNRSEQLRVIPGQPPTMLGKFAGCPFVERCDRALEKCQTTRPEVSSESPTHVFACWNPVAPAGRHS